MVISKLELFMLGADCTICFSVNDLSRDRVDGLFREGGDSIV